MEKEGKNKSQYFCYCPKIKLELRNLSQIFIGEKKEMERKKNGQIKEVINMRMLVLSYKIQLVVSNIYTKCLIPRCCSSWQKFYTISPMHLIKLKKERKKEGKINSSIMVFMYTLYLNSL